MLRAGGAPDDALILAACRAVAAKLERRVDEVADAVLARLGAAVSDAEPAVDVIPMLRIATHAHVAGALDVICAGEPELAAHAPSAVLDHARLLARHGVPVTVLSRCCRSVHAEVAIRVTDLARAVTSDLVLRELTVQRISECLLAYDDHVTDEALRAHDEERADLGRRPDVLREEAVARVLAGESMDLDVPARLLGHDLTGGQLAIVFWADGDSHASDLAHAVDAVVATLPVQGVRSSLVVATADRVRTAWFGADPAVLDALSATAASCGPHDVAVAVGEVGAGVEGFRTSHTEAMLVRQLLMVAAGDVRAPARYGDLAVAAMLSGDLPRVADFVRRELGPLANDDPESRRLRETLRGCLRHGQARAAADLGVHKNTVRYRVRHCERLLERPITERRFELEVALRLAHAFGAGVGCADPR
jgi:hypothetical protein